MSKKIHPKTKIKRGGVTKERERKFGNCSMKKFDKKN